MNTVIYFEVDYSDFDDFINEEYGHPFEFAADQECINDSEHSFEVTKKTLDKWEIADIEKFRATGQGFMVTYVLLQDLVNRDRLPEGNYLIRVSW